MVLSVMYTRAASSTGFIFEYIPDLHIAITDSTVRRLPAIEKKSLNANHKLVNHA